MLQRQDDRYLLKFHTGASSMVPGGTPVKVIHSPIIKFSMMLVRPVATNKHAFYLMNTGGSVQVGAQLYELEASRDPCYLCPPGGIRRVQGNGERSWIKLLYQMQQILLQAADYVPSNEGAQVIFSSTVSRYFSMR